MKKVDYNKLMCILGLLCVITFAIFVFKDSINYNNMTNSAPFYIFVFVRIIEFLLPGLILIYLYNQNTSIKLTKYDVNLVRLPNLFREFKIAQISDFHNTNSKRIAINMKRQLKNNKPDIIVITGDLIDSRRTDLKIAKKFIGSIKGIAPIYYVLGNHEARISDIQELEKELKSLGVNILRNGKIELVLNEQSIEILGLDDLALHIPLVEQQNAEKIKEYIQTSLKDMMGNSSKFKILLVHRPELVDIYSISDIDLIFSGHAHGGQIRIPIIGGIFAPGQGLFPKYTNGVHEKNNTKIVISRGVGNSGFPFRINNRPELVIACLKNNTIIPH